MKEESGKVQTDIENTLLQKANQVLTFFLGEEEYGVNILSVMEIRGYEPATPIPTSPNYINGVINLRGSIIPVIDLRKRFGLPEKSYGPATVCIVLQLAAEQGNKIAGIIVDAVSDVYSIDQSLIQPKPDMCDTKHQDYISGLMTITVDQENKLVIILDINKIILVEDIMVNEPHSTEQVSA